MQSDADINLMTYSVLFSSSFFFFINPTQNIVSFYVIRYYHK